MSVATAIGEIENLKFAARVGVANSFRAFLRNISSESAALELLRESQSLAGAQKVLERVLALSKVRGDIRYLHRFDIPLATYLWVLSRTSQELARVGAEAAVYLPKTWWTEQVVSYVLGSSFEKSSATGADVKTAIATTRADTSNVAVSTSTIFSGIPADSSRSAQTVRIESREAGNAAVDANEDADVPVLRYTTNTEKPG